MRFDPRLFRAFFDWSQEGTPKSQVGAMHREAWLIGWSLYGPALGMDDAQILREREIDELALPEHDVGLFGRLNVVYAVKA